MQLSLFIQASELRDPSKFTYGDKLRGENPENLWKRKRDEALDPKRGFNDGIDYTGTWVRDVPLADHIAANGITTPIELAIYKGGVEVYNGHHRISVAPDDYWVPVEYVDFTVLDDDDPLTWKF